MSTLEDLVDIQKKVSPTLQALGNVEYTYIGGREENSPYLAVVVKGYNGKTVTEVYSVLKSYGVPYAIETQKPTEGFKTTSKK